MVFYEDTVGGGSGDMLQSVLVPVLTVLLHLFLVPDNPGDPQLHWIIKGTLVYLVAAHSGIHVLRPLFLLYERVPLFL